MMISLQKIITKLKSLIDKNTADITALNNDLTNTSVVQMMSGAGEVYYTVRGKLLELKAFWFGGSGVAPNTNVLLCTLPYKPLTWHHFASAYNNGVFTIDNDGKFFFFNNTSENITYACMHEIIFIE